MKLKTRSAIQIIITLAAISCTIIYYLYINDYISFRILSLGDMNPYGGWSALKSAFTDVSYRWRGISRTIALSIGLGVVSFALGRFFCGYMCPIGALQDFSAYIGKRLNIKAVKIPDKIKYHLNFLKYVILIGLIILSILGLGSFLSPFSPWISYLNIFNGFQLQIGTLVLLLIVILSLFIKRVFCRFFCPLGAFQSLLYAVGPFKIYKGQECNGCSSCLKSCPVEIDYSQDEYIEPECINCLECVNSQCVKNSSGYSLRFAGRILMIKKYIAISSLLILSIYFFLPLLKTPEQRQALASTVHMRDGLYTGRGIGFGGNIQVQVNISNNKIININVLEHDETSGYYEEVFKNVAKDIIENQNLSVDAISGATVTSRGFINAVKTGVGIALDIN